MRKLTAAILMLSAASYAADVKTNWVYVVSNIYYYSESVVTQKVKNTHYNYYYTNNVYVVTNIVVEVSRTNLHLNVVWDNFGPWVSAASNSAMEAASSVANASRFANDAATYSTSAGSSASSASASASRAAASASSAQNAADNGLAAINTRIAWFDEWSSNKVITVVHTNIDLSIDPSLSFPYTSPAGTTYDNVLYYPVDNANGKVCATQIGSAASGSALVLYYKASSSGTSANASFKYDIGNVSSDTNGMLIRFIVRDRALADVTYGSVRRLILPRDCYWQAGSYFAVFDIYNTSTNWVGRCKFGSGSSISSAYPFPSNIYGGSSDAFNVNFPRLTVVYKTDYSGHPFSSSTVSIKTEHDSVLPVSSPLWIPATPTQDQQATITWINTFPQQ